MRRHRGNASNIHPDKFALVRKAEREGSRLQSLDLDYELGGGRSGGHGPHGLMDFRDFSPGDKGGDCSWLTCLLCGILGIPLKNPIGWTGTLATEGKPGHGKIFTIHIKDPFETEGHVINQFHHPVKDHWIECGGRDNPQPGDGVSWFKPTAERIAEFTVQRHFEGF